MLSIADGRRDRWRERRTLAVGDPAAAIPGGIAALRVPTSTSHREWFKPRLKRGAADDNIKDKQRRGGKRSRVTLYSELAEGGVARWWHFHGGGGDGGWTQIALPRDAVNWQLLAQGMGTHAVLEFQGWLVAAFRVPRDGRYLVHCAGVPTFFVDDVPLVGDLYGAGLGHSPVDLTAGADHALRVRLRAKMQTRLSCAVAPASAAAEKSSRADAAETLVLSAPAVTVAPDLLEGRLTSPWVGVTLLNTGDAPLRVTGVRWTSSDDAETKRGRSKTRGREGPGGLAVRLSSHPLDALPLSPAAWQQVTLVLSHVDGDVDARRACARPADGGDPEVRGLVDVLAAPVSAGDEEASAPSAASASGTVVVRVEVSVRCRGRGSTFRLTFRDADGAVTRAAAAAPLAKSAEDASTSLPARHAAVPIVVSLHGTGVPPENQADAYKVGDGRGGYVFGVEGAWLLAAHRDGAHNWEGIGLASAAAAVDALAELTGGATTETTPTVPLPAGWNGALSARVDSSDGARTLRADASRVIVAGHSMGGHGAFILAATLGDRLLGLAAGAGWLRKETYGDANRAFYWDVGASHAPAALRAALLAPVAEFEADALAPPNLAGVPVLVFVGAMDGTVPPYESR